MGTVAGLANWLAVSLKAAFAFVGIGSLALLLSPQYGDGEVRLLAIVSCLLFTLVNVVSVESTGKLQNALVIALLALLASFVVFAAPATEPSRYKPFFTGGAANFFTVVGMVFVSFGGLVKVVDVSEEVKNPKHNLPLGMFSAFVIVMIIYVTAVAITIGVVPAKVLDGSLTPLATAAKLAVGQWAMFAIAAAAFLAYATTGNAGILAASRSPTAMSRDGLLPEIFAYVSKRLKTPIVSIVVTATIICLIIGFLDVESLVKIASTMLLVSFLLANVAVIVMRKSRLQSYRPTFKMPLVPILPAIAVLIYLFLIIEMGVIPLEVAAAFIGATLLWYLTYVHYRIDRQSAVIYTVKMTVAGKMDRTGLEDELVAISLEREGVERDRFDELVVNGQVLDVKGRVSARELFEQLSVLLAPGLALSEKEVYELFLEREGQSSTVILPGVAIPHIIVPGTGIFQIALVRSNEGVVFSDLNPPVKTVFALLGSEDERNFHLKALVAVAHVLQNADFEERWMAASNEEQLRDVVLLARRRRR